MYVIVVVEKLTGLYLTTSHAAQVNSPVVFELVPIMQHNDVITAAPSVYSSDVHYLWVFGDEAS